MIIHLYAESIPIIQIRPFTYEQQNNQLHHPIKPYITYTNAINPLTHYSNRELACYFHHHGLSSIQILNQLDLYSSDEFIKLIKTYPEYKNKITALYTKFNNLSNFKKILYRLIGGYSSRLHKHINTLYEEIQKQKDTATNFSLKRDLKKLSSDRINEYESLADIYKAHSPLLANAIEKRFIAISDDELHNILHEESSSIRARAYSLLSSSPLQVHQETLLDCSDAIALYTKEDQTDKAMTIADFCWTLLDYGQAIAEGAAVGLYGSIDDILTHPIEATVCIVAGKQVLAYQLAKVLYNVAEIGITALHDYNRGKEKWDEYIEPINNLITAINNKEITVRDTLKTGTGLVVGYKAQTKLLGGLGKFFTTVKAKAINFAKNNSLTKPIYYLATPEGMILKASHDAENIGSVSQGVVNPSLLLLETTYAKVAVELRKEIEFLQKKYDSVVNGFAEISYKKLKINYEHILGMEINITKKGKIGLSGFHHDFNNFIEKTGILEFSNKSLDKHGCYKTRLLNKGDYVKEITFFPSHWSLEKVISKIYEAYNNFKKDIDIFELKKDGKYLMRSATNEGIEINIFITKNGLITTAYPTLITRNNGIY